MLFLLLSWVRPNRVCLKKMFWKQDLEWPGCLLLRCKTVIHHPKSCCGLHKLIEGLHKLIEGLHKLIEGLFIFFKNEHLRYLKFVSISSNSNSHNMSSFDHPTERGTTDLYLRQHVWFTLCIWLWKWLRESRRKCHQNMFKEQSVEWGKHQLYRYWRITKDLFLHKGTTSD